MDKNRKLVKDIATALGVEIFFRRDCVNVQPIMEGFNPVAELVAGNYAFDKSLGIGKFDKPYYVPAVDLDGKQFALASFPSSAIDAIGWSLPKGVFIPKREDIEQWSIRHISANWHTDPSGVLAEFNVSPNNANGAVSMVTSTVDAHGERSFTEVYAKLVEFATRHHTHWGAIPIFFTEQFMTEQLSEKHIKTPKEDNGPHCSSR